MEDRSADRVLVEKLLARDERAFAEFFDTYATVTGFEAAGIGLAGLWFPPLELAATIVGSVSAVSGVIAAVFTGFEYGFDSNEFSKSAGLAALGLITFGQSKLIGIAAKEAAPVVTKIAQFGTDIVSPVTTVLSHIF